MSDKARKTPGKMQLFLMDAAGEHVLAFSNPGDISDKAVRGLVDTQGEGKYQVITGRARSVSLSSKTVVEFKVGA